MILMIITIIPIIGGTESDKTIPKKRAKDL